MKMMKLIYNEIIKQTKKLSFKICFIILLIAAVLIPVFAKMYTLNDDMQSYPLYTPEEIEMFEIEKTENPKTSEEIYMNEVTELQKEVTKLGIKNKAQMTEINSDLYNAYIEYSQSILCIDKYLSGQFDEKTFEKFYYLEDLKNPTKEELELLKKENQDKKEITYQAIESGEYKNFLIMKTEELKNDESIAKDEYFQNKIKYYEKLVELGITNQKDSRLEKVMGLIDLESFIEVPVSEKEYKVGYSEYNASYETYLKATEMSNNSIKDDITKGWYSIEKGIEYENDLKATMETTNMVNKVILSLVTIIIAGSIVANEFQKGTIRLLVITSNKRWKILLSKFMAVVVLIIGLSLISYIISFIVSGLLFGFSSYFMPDLKVVSGVVTEQSYLINQLITLIYNIIPVVFVGLIAFFLSTITNNTAVSVGIAIFLLAGYELPTMLLAYLGFPFTIYTFLPYLDFSQFLDYELLGTNILNYGYIYSVKTAIIVLAIWSIIIYIVTNLVFARKDIKN